VNRDSAPDLIFIDDSESLAQAWEMAGATVNKNVKIYHSAAKLLSEIERYSQSTPLYIDSQLEGQMSGEELAKILYDKGYRELYLATGYPPEHFSHCTWLKAVVGKNPPFFE
jgi:FixJ family two-component response regulator